MAQEKGKAFVSEVFGNLTRLLDHHQRMLAALFSRQRDQHPLVQSVADIILDRKLSFSTCILFFDPSTQMHSSLPLSMKPISNIRLYRWSVIEKSLIKILAIKISSRSVLETRA
jgi:hypothetical protein